MNFSIDLTPEQIEAWVARHFEYKRRKNGEELLICNPFDGDDSYKFNISTIKKTSKRSGVSGYWVHDWRPSAAHHGGSFLKFVQKYKGFSFREAIRDVCGDGINLKSILKSMSAPPEEIIIEQILTLPDNAVPIQESKWPKFQKMACKYLLSRGIDLKIAKSFQVHYTPTTVVFPYLEYEMIVYWQSRSMIGKKFEFPDERKTGIGKSEFLYGFDNAEPRGRVFITEAIFDAITIGPGGLASGGATIAKSQMKKLRALSPSELILAPDNDKQGKISIYENWGLLKNYYDLYYVLPPDQFKDWNEMACSYKDYKIGLAETRKYLHGNIKKLTLAEAMKFRLNDQYGSGPY